MRRAIGRSVTGVSSASHNAGSRGVAMKTIRLVVVAAACVLVLPTTVAVQSTGDGGRTAGKQWPAVSGDSGNTRHSTLNQITTQNIGKLGAAWTSQKFDAPAGA